LSVAAFQVSVIVAPIAFAASPVGAVGGTVSATIAAASFEGEPTLPAESSAVTL